MAYDAAKAHEYYIKYRKKGLKKGRKKGKAKKAAQTNLVGLSSAGLNDAGKMQAALIRENIKKEMNAALAKETDPVKREAIRQQYQNKALSEISKLKNNPQYAQAKKASAGKKGSTKSSGGSTKSSGSSRSSSGSSQSSGSSSSSGSSTQENTQRLNNLVDLLSQKVLSMSNEQKAETKTLLTQIVSLLKGKSENYINNIRRLGIL